MNSEENIGDDKPVPLEINGVLDLHRFRPKDIGRLIPDYIEACLARNIYEIRIIHGKGTGQLRESVHSILRKDVRVASFALATDRSAWGATLVKLVTPLNSLY